MIVLILSVVLAFLFVRLLIPFLAKNLPDLPNARSLHNVPVPRGGGVVFVVLSCLSSAVFMLSSASADPSSVLLLSAPLAVVGLVDDRFSLSSSLRFVIQAATGFFLLLYSPLVYSRTCISGGFFDIFVLIVLLLLVTSVVNFTNFMDGVDGLVAGCMTFSISALAIGLSLAWPIWVLVGSLFGFLLWNWSPAKIFMGDVGSTFLGAVFAGLVLQASSWPEAFGFLLVPTPLLGDACLCLFRRLLAGQRVFQAHRLHLFQRLHQAGWPHARVSITYIAATAVLALAMLVGGWPLVFGLAVVVLLVGVCLDQLVAVPFAVASKN